MKCSECNEDFPPDIMSIFVSSGDERIRKHMCGVCALAKRNRIHGLPMDAPFSGGVAQWCYEEALEIKKKREASNGTV